jgi:hypothetical protein
LQQLLEPPLLLTHPGVQQLLAFLRRLAGVSIFEWDALHARLGLLPHAAAAELIVQRAYVERLQFARLLAKTPAEVRAAARPPVPPGTVPYAGGVLSGCFDAARVALAEAEAGPGVPLTAEMTAAAALKRRRSIALVREPVALSSVEPAAGGVPGSVHDAGSGAVGWVAERVSTIAESGSPGVGDTTALAAAPPRLYSFAGPGSLAALDREVSRAATADVEAQERAAAARRRSSLLADELYNTAHEQVAWTEGVAAQRIADSAAAAALRIPTAIQLRRRLSIVGGPFSHSPSPQLPPRSLRRRSVVAAPAAALLHDA